MINYRSESSGWGRPCSFSKHHLSEVTVLVAVDAGSTPLSLCCMFSLTPCFQLFPSKKICLQSKKFPRIKCDGRFNCMTLAHQLSGLKLLCFSAFSASTTNIKIFLAPNLHFFLTCHSLYTSWSYTPAFMVPWFSSAQETEVCVDRMGWEHHLVANVYFSGLSKRLSRNITSVIIISPVNKPHPD